MTTQGLTDIYLLCKNTQSLHETFIMKTLSILSRKVSEVKLGLYFLKLITSVNSNQKFGQY